MFSVSPSPKVITLSGLHCNANFNAVIAEDFISCYVLYYIKYLAIRQTFRHFLSHHRLGKTYS
jgi:hypothetical protein